MKLKCWNCKYIFYVDEDEEEEYECQECYALNTSDEEYFEDKKEKK